MRLLRFLGLVAFLAAAYFAQYIFDRGTLADFFPDRLLQAVPSLAQYTLWLTNDLLLLATALAFVAALGFGLLTPPWRTILDRADSGHPGNRTSSAVPGKLASLPLWLSFIGVAGVALVLWATGQETLIVFSLWLLSVAFFVGGVVLLDRRTERAAPNRRLDGGLVACVLLAALLFGWQIASLPSQIDGGLADFSVEALRGSEGARFFLPGSQGLPRAAYLASALFLQIGQNVLIEMRLAGLLAGIVAVAATWLLASELFTRPVALDGKGSLLEGDGRWMAALAAVLLTITIASLHFARLPFYIEPLAWGMLSLWSWFRGLRRNRYGWLGASGLFAGLAMTLSPVGLVFPLAGLLWWAAVPLFDPAWIGPYGRGQRFLIWCGGLWVFVAPLIGTWLNAPSRLTSYVHAPAFLDAVVFLPDASLLGLNLRRTLFAFNYTADLSAVFAYPDHLLHSLLAPLFILAIGALVLNLDTWVGWTLLTWLVVGLFVAAWLGPRAPFVPVMLPMLPAAALAVAFAVDRTRATIVQSAGDWIEQAVLIFMTGLLVWVGINSWLRYYPFAASAGNAVSEVARVAHASPDAPALVLVNGPGSEPLNWRDAPLLLVQSDLPRMQARGAIAPPDWPEGLPAGARLLLQPSDRALLDELLQRYPGGAISLRRDIHGNPVVYMYDLP